MHNALILSLKLRCFENGRQWIIRIKNTSQCVLNEMEYAQAKVYINGKLLAKEWCLCLHVVHSNRIQIYDKFRPLFGLLWERWARWNEHQTQKKKTRTNKSMRQRRPLNVCVRASFGDFYSFNKFCKRFTIITSRSVGI